MNKIYLFLLVLTAIVSCRKPKITLDSLKGNWTFTEYTSYIADTSNNYTSKVVQEGGYLMIEKDSILISTGEIMLGKAKLPYMFTDNPSSLYYNNGNNYMYEDNIYMAKNDLNHKKKGNYRNFLQSTIQFFNPSNPSMSGGGFTVEMIQKSKNEMTLKIFTVNYFNTSENFAYNIIELKKQ